MDSWRHVEGFAEPWSTLYILKAAVAGTPSRYSVERSKEVISRNFDSDQMAAFLNIDHSHPETAPSNLFLTSEDARNFALIEDHELWHEGGIPKGSGILDIEPLRGRLVLFDSIALAHEVR